MISALIALFVLLALALVVLLILGFKKKESGHQEQPVVYQKTTTTKMTVCPLCKSLLNPGERIHSIRFPGKEESTMHIHGCPYCYREHPHPISEKPKQRVCPSCLSSLPEKGYVLARVTEKAGKTHVNVVGCTLCR